MTSRFTVAFAPDEPWLEEAFALAGEGVRHQTLNMSDIRKVSNAQRGLRARRQN